MIKAKDVERYLELRTLISEANKHLKDLGAEANDLEASLVQAVSDRERIEGACPYKITVETGEKTYNPPYKECAIFFAGEKALNEWVEKTHPHLPSHKLKFAKKNLLFVPKVSRKVADVLSAIVKMKRAA